MRVWISVHGRFHAFDLARELGRHRALAGLATTYPALAVRRFLGPGISLRSAPWLELARRIGQHISWPAISDVQLARAFGRFSARNFDRSADIFVGWSGASLEAIAPARNAGLRVVIERGSSHIEHQAAVLSEEYLYFGVDSPAVDPRVIARERAEYEAADAVAVPSQFAAGTFRRAGIQPDKLIVNPYGVDIERFGWTPRQSRPRPTRILFVGTVGLRKGVPWLLRAFARVTSPSELHLVGPMERGMEQVLRREPLDRVVLHGPLSGARLAQAYRDADIFCLPSIEEGLPLSCLQAMATGLPIVVTPETGMGDAITGGGGGVLVPAREPQRLAECLESLAAKPEYRHATGQAARSNVERGYSWVDYGNRALTAYAGLLTSTRVANPLALTGTTS